MVSTLHSSHETVLREGQGDVVGVVISALDSALLRSALRISVVEVAWG